MMVQWIEAKRNAKAKERNLVVREGRRRNVQRRKKINATKRKIRVASRRISVPTFSQITSLAMVLSP